MKNEYRSYYIILSIMIILYMIAFSIGNIFVYGSVLQVNTVILPLLLVIPLYSGFKQELFLKRMAILMSSYFFVILLITVLILPKYTFNEAKKIVTEGTQTNWSLHLKRNTDDANFFYKGQYLVETNAGSYAFDIKKGTYEPIQK